MGRVDNGGVRSEENVVAVRTSNSNSNMSKSQNVISKTFALSQLKIPNH